MRGEEPSVAAPPVHGTLRLPQLTMIYTHKHAHNPPYTSVASMLDPEHTPSPSRLLAPRPTAQEELAVFPLAPDADQGVGEEARPGLVPLLVRLLFPKMRKRSGRLGGRGAPGSARAAILNFLANLRPAELRPLLELLLEPMAMAFVEPPAAVAAAAAPRPGGAAAEAEAAELDRFRLLPPPRWSAAMLGRGVGWWLAAVEQAALDALPPRRKIGFLNACELLRLVLPRCAVWCVGLVYFNGVSNVITSL
mgnify:CR=1 FL=1